MDLMEFLQSARDEYLTRYRAAIRKCRQTESHCHPEVWVQPNSAPGSEETPDPLCIDILCGERDNPKVFAVMGGEAPEGAKVGTMQIGGARLTVFPIAWEMCVVWFARAIDAPDWSALASWKSKWMDRNKGACPGDEDELCNVAHYLGKPVSEGGGFLFEVDFGSAPLDALMEMLDVLVGMGAREIELGRSDGSHLDPQILAEIEQTDIPLPRFTELIARLLEQEPHVTRAVVQSEEQIEVTMVDCDHPTQMFTPNLHARLGRVGREARAKEVARFIRGQREMHTDSPVNDLSQLRPVIKDDRFMNNVSELGKGKLSLLARRLVADLWVCCVWDTPNGMRFVTPDEAGQYGFTEEQMHARALQNFVKERAAVEFVNHPPLLVLRTGDCYDASLLLDDALWEQAAKKVSGIPLACVPSRDTLLVVGADTPGALQALKDAAGRIEAGGDHLISSTILQRRDAAWHELPSMTASEPTFQRKRWWKIW